MSILRRLITALASVVIVLCAFLAVFSSTQIVELLSVERKATIQNTVVSSMFENRFAFYSASSSGLDDWLKTVSAPKLIDYVAIVDEKGKVTNFVGNRSLINSLGEIGGALKVNNDNEHLRLDIEIKFQDGETVEGYSSLVLLIKSGQSTVYKRVLATIAYVLVFAIIVILPLLVFLTRWVRAPVQTIISQIQGITPKTLGETPLTITEKTPVDLLPIIETVNSLLFDIRRHTHNLDSLVEDRTSLLSEALLSLQANERQKQALISNLSHDLKTPLASITGYLELVQEQLEVEEYENVKSNIAKAQINSESILSEINTILNISTAKLDGDQAINKVNISALVNEIIGKHEILTSKSDNTIEYSLVGNELVEMNDSTFIHVIDNLISNSNKYATNGKIKIDICSDANITVSVMDEGQGLKASRLRTLFEPKRVKGSARFSLSGMGLFLCKLRIEHAGGAIRADSVVDGGLKITFRLPNMGM